jgi:hypothetical protein
VAISRRTELLMVGAVTGLLLCACATGSTRSSLNEGDRQATRTPDAAVVETHAGEPDQPMLVQDPTWTPRQRRRQSCLACLLSGVRRGGVRAFEDRPAPHRTRRCHPADTGVAHVRHRLRAGARRGQSRQTPRDRPDAFRTLNDGVGWLAHGTRRGDLDTESVLASPRRCEFTIESSAAGPTTGVEVRTGRQATAARARARAR